MSQARWVSRDEIEAPMTARGSDGETGDGLVIIGPDHKDFQAWADWLEGAGKVRPK